MELRFGPMNILSIDEARIVYRNFSGEASKYNREGDRNFSIVIPDDETADLLIKEGWNVKIKQPRNEEEEPFRTLPVKIKFNDRGPYIYVKTGNKLNRLSENNVSMIDNINISSVDLDIRPYDWEVNDKTGRTAYLQGMKVVQTIDRFAEEGETVPEIPEYHILMKRLNYIINDFKEEMDNSVTDDEILNIVDLAFKQYIENENDLPF